MSLLERNAKIYGAVETETFMTFEGFCKKIYNTEQQKVDVFIDDKKIDTILANQKILKIEDTYEVFDTEGFCFTYKLPKEYIGKKHKLEFKTIDGEQLVHSPITTIDSSDDKYNECSFIESLNESIDENKIKDLYCPNSIGFLATEENLEDEEFIEYINQLIIDFPNCVFKALTFSDNLNQHIIDLFKSKELKIIKISNVYDILKNVEIYLSNNDRNELDTKILQEFGFHCTDVFFIGLNLNLRNTLVEDFESNNFNYFKNFFNNLEYLGFDNNSIKYGKTYHEIYFKKAYEEYNLNINFDMKERVSKAYVYWNLKLGLSNHKYFIFTMEFARKFARLQ